jgi:hypothetical protein
MRRTVVVTGGSGLLALNWAAGMLDYGGGGKIEILTSDPGHPVVPRLRGWQRLTQGAGHEVSLLFDREDLTGGRHPVPRVL